MRFDLETKASPEQVRSALTDFTDRRPQIWNRTLDAKKYELRPLLFLLHHGPLGRMISRMWAAALDRYAQADPG